MAWVQSPALRPSSVLKDGMPRVSVTSKTIPVGMGDVSQKGGFRDQADTPRQITLARPLSLCSFHWSLMTSQEKEDSLLSRELKSKILEIRSLGRICELGLE